MIKEKRKQLGFTQEQIADKLNISLRQYVRIDNEEDLPRIMSDDEIGKYIRSITQKIA